MHPEAISYHSKKPNHKTQRHNSLTSRVAQSPQLKTLKKNITILGDISWNSMHLYFVHHLTMKGEKCGQSCLHHMYSQLRHLLLNHAPGQFNGDFGLAGCFTLDPINQMHFC